MTLDVAWTAGRYGGYVLSTYGISLLALLWLGLHTHRRWRAEIKLARRRALASGKRQQAS